MTVLILSLTYEPSTDSVIERLNRMGVPWIRVNMNDFAATATCSVSSNGDVVIKSYGCEARGEDITSVWFRKYSRDINMKKYAGYAEAFFVRRTAS
jgi:hypothetical protein